MDVYTKLNEPANAGTLRPHCQDTPTFQIHQIHYILAKKACPRAYRASCPAYQAALDRFEQHMTARGLSPSTRLNYVRALRDMQERAGTVAEELY